MTGLRRFAAVVVSVAVAAFCAWTGYVLADPEPVFQTLTLMYSDAAQSVNFLYGIYPQFPHFALLLLGLVVAGGLLAALGGEVRLAWDDIWNGLAASPASTPARPVTDWLRPALLLLYLVQAGLWFCLWREVYFAALLPIWAIGQLGFVLVWRAADRAAGHRATRLFSGREVLCLFGLCLAFSVYAGSLSTDAHYAWASDEIPFFTLARQIAAAGTANPFSPHGAFGYHPVMASLWMAWFMRLLGPSVFAWRLSSVVAVALGIPAIYLFARETIGRRGAVAASVLFAAGHYVITFALKGFNNGHVIAPTFWALGLWVAALRQRSSMLMYLAGVASGLGFYSYYTSRLTLGFLGVAFLFAVPWSRRQETMRWAGVYLLGVLVTVAPLLVSTSDFLGPMVRETALREAGNAGGGPLAALWTAVAGPAALRKWQWLILDPFYSVRSERFVYGSFTDAWTACFALVGLVWALLRGWRRRQPVWLVACTFAVALVAGILAKYELPPYTRMLLLVPFLTVAAGLAVQVITEAWGGSRFGRVAGTLFIATLLLLATVVNQYRLRITGPQMMGIDPHGLMVQLAQTTPSDRQFYYVVPPPHGGDAQLLLADVYGYADRAHLLSATTFEAQEEELSFPAVLVFAQMFDKPVDDLVRLARDRYPDHTLRVLRDERGVNEVIAVEITHPNPARPPAKAG